MTDHDLKFQELARIAQQAINAGKQLQIALDESRRAVTLARAEIHELTLDLADKETDLAAAEQEAEDISASLHKAQDQVFNLQLQLERYEGPREPLLDARGNLEKWQQSGTKFRQAADSEEHS